VTISLSFLSVCLSVRPSVRPDGLSRNFI